jgi:hypothetical protein
MAVSFANDIKPLFRPIDIDHMKSFGIPLDDFAYMSDPANADSVLQTVIGNPPSMPPGGPYWAADQVALYKEWIAGGYQP